MAEKDRERENVYDRKMRICGFANVCLRVCACTCLCEIEQNREKRERKAKRDVFTQGEMMQRALADTKVLPQD